MPVAMALPRFEDGLFARNIVATMAIDENETAKPVYDEILEQPVQQVEIGSRRS